LDKVFARALRRVVWGYGSAALWFLLFGIPGPSRYYYGVTMTMRFHPIYSLIGPEAITRLSVQVRT